LVALHRWLFIFCILHFLNSGGDAALFSKTKKHGKARKRSSSSAKDGGTVVSSSTPKGASKVGGPARPVW
jgi:hypothetical protein